MKLIFVDISVSLDAITEDESWLEWSVDQITRLAEENILAINSIIYAELSPLFDQRRKFARMRRENSGFLNSRMKIHYIRETTLS